MSIDELSEVVSVGSKRAAHAPSSLLRRSLIEQTAARFSLQPIVMDYATGQLVQQVCAEVETQKLKWLRTHAPLKPKPRTTLEKFKGD